MTRFRLSLAFFMAVLVSIWARPSQVETPPGAEADRFVQVAKESAARPVEQWALLTLRGQPFVERPPLGLVLQSFAFRFFGAEFTTAVRLTQVYATLLALVVLSVSLALGAGRAAHYALLGLLCLPGFWIEARDPVLEMPITLAFAASMLAGAGLYRICSREMAPGLALAAGNCVIFALTTTAVFLLDGLKSLAAFVPLIVLSWLQPRMRRYALFAVFLSVVSAALFAGSFELVRLGSHLPPFIPAYLATQFHVPDPSPGAFFVAFSKWYFAVFPAMIFVIWRFWKDPRENPLAWVSVAWIVTILLAFPLSPSTPVWYVHPAMLGAAWLIGEAFATIVTPRWERWVALITAIISLGVAVFT